MQSPRILAVGAGITAQAFAESLSIAPAVHPNLDPEGVFRFKTQPFEVKAPFPLLEDFVVSEAPTWVDFMIGVTATGFNSRYSVQVYPGPSGPDAEKNFAAASPNAMKDFITTDLSKAGVKIVLVDEGPTIVNGRSAYRAIGIDRSHGIPEIMIGTSILFSGNIVVASSVFPVTKGLSDQELADWPRWSKFTSWVGTIRNKQAH